MPVLLRWLGLLSATETLAILAGAFTLATVWCFLQEQAGYVVFFAALTWVVLLMLRRERARHKRGTKPQT
ncbi:hypothetical protein [Streptomyces sp. 7N604]|uniref:hypothetical protein n=1 Tax=Streptomyces sp. 7N604 TaxID=3457415 RepID=UPI003FCF95BC